MKAVPANQIAVHECDYPSGNQLPYTQREKSELSNFATLYMLYHTGHCFSQCRFRHCAPETAKARRRKVRQTDTQVGINEQNKRHRRLRYIDQYENQ
jgi:hypothetical protein